MNDLRGIRPLLALLLGFALAASLAACGGGGSSSTSTVSTPTSTDTSTTTATGPSAAKPSGPSAASETAAARRKAGRAAPFVSPKSDNSVPTFGSEAAATERSDAEANLRAYLSARAARDWGKACRYLAAQTREGYERLGASSGKGPVPCVRVLPVLAPIRSGVPANPLTGRLVALRARGANGFALFYGPPGHQQYMVPMNREAGEWRPTQAAPIAYPPGAPG